MTSPIGLVRSISDKKMGLTLGGCKNAATANVSPRMQSPRMASGLPPQIHPRIGSITMQTAPNCRSWRSVGDQLSSISFMAKEFSIEGELCQVLLSFSRRGGFYLRHFSQYIATDYQGIHFCSHKTLKCLLWATDDGLAPDIETGVDDHRASGQLVERGQ